MSIFFPARNEPLQFIFSWFCYTRRVWHVGIDAESGDSSSRTRSDRYNRRAFLHPSDPTLLRWQRKLAPKCWEESPIRVLQPPRFSQAKLCVEFTELACLRGLIRLLQPPRSDPSLFSDPRQGIKSRAPRHQGSFSQQARL